MRIVVATYMHGKKRAYQIQANCVNRLRHSFGVIPVVVGSHEEPTDDIVEENGFYYYQYRNKPLGEKANYTAVCASLYDPDYVVFLDSDDIICSALMHLYVDAMREGYDWIGVKDTYFYGLNDKRSKFDVFGYWPGYGHPNRTTGVAKCLSKAMLEKVDWRPFNRRVNSGLDGTMRGKVSRYRPRKKTISIRDTKTFCCDIKSRGNLNGIGNYKLVNKIDQKSSIPLKYQLEIADPIETMLKHIPELEVDYIMTFRDEIITNKHGQN